MFVKLDPIPSLAARSTCNPDSSPPHHHPCHLPADPFHSVGMTRRIAASLPRLLYRHHALILKASVSLFLAVVLFLAVDPLQWRQREEPPLDLSHCPAHATLADPPPRPSSARFAYTTLITSPSYVMSALVWCTALRLTGTPHHIVLMTAMDGPFSLPILHHHFDLILPVPLVPSKYGAKHFAKLQAWRMEQYEKVVFMDVDALALGNLNFLFEREEPTGVPSYSTEAFNCGMLVLKPSQSYLPEPLLRMLGPPSCAQPPPSPFRPSLLLHATSTSPVAKIDMLGPTDNADQGYLNCFSECSNLTPSCAHLYPFPPPQQATFTSLVAKIDVLGSTDNADQGYLNRYWPGFANMTTSHRLPYRFNAMLLYPRNYPPPRWYDVDRAHEIMGPVMVAHLGGPWGKPAGMGSNRPVPGPNGCHWCFVNGEQPYAVWLKIWYNVSRALYNNCWFPLDAGGGVASGDGGSSGGGGERGEERGEEQGEGPGRGERLLLRSSSSSTGFSLTAGLPNAADYEAAEPGKKPRAAEWVRPSMTESAVEGPGGAESAATSGSSGGGGRLVVATVVSARNQHAAVPWAMSYNKHHPPGPSRVPSLVLVLPSVPSSHRQLLEPLCDHVRSVPSVGRAGREDTEEGQETEENKAQDEDEEEEEEAEMSVLQVWNQTDFDQVLYVDVLSLFATNIHLVFSDFQPFAAPPLRFPPDMFSTRVMLLRPNQEVLSRMLQTRQDRASSGSGGNGSSTEYLDLFLNAYYGTWFYESPQHRMPYAYAVNLRYNQRLRQYHPHPRIVTFDGDSPLHMDVRVWADPTGGSSINYGRVWHGYWQEGLGRWPRLRSLQAKRGGKR
ncbi:unnamed protein product [Closterium sp. NIES-53]